jgi:ABC-2 type transport system permease protein
MRRFFARYYLFTLHGLQGVLSYRAGFALAIVTSSIGLMAQLYLWRAIYAQNAMLAGYTLADMCTYLLMSNLLYLALENRVEHEISADIGRGDIVVHFVRPNNYLVMRFFSALPIMLSNIVMVGLPVCLLGSLLFSLKFPGPGDLALFAASAMLSMLTGFLINTLMGVAAFVTTNIWGLQVMKTAVVGILSGYLIPLAFFGGALGQWARLLPFSSMIDAPLTLFLGKYHGAAEVAGLLGLQLFWVLALGLVCALVWDRASGRLEVLGG